MASVYLDQEREATQVQNLVSFLISLDNLDERMAEYRNLVAGSQLSACMTKLATEFDLVFDKATDTDLISFFALFTTLLNKVGGNLVEELTSNVTSKLASSNDRKYVRLQILVDFFNLETNKARKAQYLNTIFQYASSSEQIEVLQHHVTAIDEWVHELNLDKEGVRKLLSSLLLGLGNSAEARDVATRFFLSFDTAEPLGEHEAFAEKLLISLVSSPTPQMLELGDLLKDCPVLQHLQGKPVHQLFEIIASGSVAKFKEFSAKESKFLADAGIDVETATQYLSTATLSFLCQTNKVIPYSEVASALGIDQDEVEFTVAEAISHGFVDVRLNQPEQTVIVRYAKKNEYGVEDWKKLGERVDAFKSNLQELIHVLQGAQQQAQ